MPINALLQKFDSVNITPRITLRNEGGEWYKALATGTFTRAAVEKSKALRYPENELCFSQFTITPLAAGSFFISVMQRSRRLGRLERTSARKFDMEASLFSFSGARGSEPAASRDWYSRMSQVTGLRSKGLLTFDNKQLSPEAGCYVLIPSLKALLGCDVDFEVAVVSKCPFELRVAAPGAQRASTAGVVWVSGREGVAGCGGGGAVESEPAQAPPADEAPAARNPAATTTVNPLAEGAARKKTAWPPPKK
jgi:hypothetical protein